MSPKVAFCITCKGRAQHLKITLPQNLADNSDYENLQFIIVNYNSPDDLMDYLQDDHANDISSGKIVVYTATDVGVFKMAHAKNLAHRLAIREGNEILVNLDADNLTGAGFATYVAKHFKKHGETSYLWSRMIKGVLPRGISGRIVVHKNTFINIGGYDERYETWSRDDKDFNERLQRGGYNPFEVDQQYLNGVRHNDKLRFKEYPHIMNQPNDYDQEYDSQNRTNTVVNFGKFGCSVVTKNFDTKLINIGPIPTRIFGIGMHKTGTTSLHAAFKTLKFSSAHWSNAHWAKNIWTEMKEFGSSRTLEKHYVLCDLPITLLYEELDKAYPGSKFILTIRPEKEWLRSVENHWNPEINQYRSLWNKDPFTHKIHKELYGQKAFDAELFIERYRKHNRDVLEYFKDRPDDLLVLHVTKKTNWKPLCKFFGLEKPTVPYPKLNVSVESNSFWGMIVTIIKRIFNQ